MDRIVLKSTTISHVGEFWAVCMKRYLRLLRGDIVFLSVDLGSSQQKFYVNIFAKPAKIKFYRHHYLENHNPYTFL